MGSQSLTFNYFKTDDLKKITRASGVTTDFTYRNAGPVQDIKIRNSSSTLLEQFAYTYDNVLNALSLADNDGTHGYGYDAVYRLTSATHPGGSGLPASESYGYDKVGNREQPGTPAAYDYDPNNRITASPGLTYTFDSDGNIATRSDGAVFTYDYVNRLKQFAKAGATTTYAYDAFGRRLRKTVGSTTTWFLWDGDVLLAEFDGSGSRTKRYAYGEAPWTPSQMEAGGALYDVHADNLGTARSLTNASQVVVWRAKYESFGKAIVNEDVDGNSVNVTFNGRLPGQYADAESADSYNRFRTYSPATGRYVEADPLGQVDAQSSNLYLYSANSPLSLYDQYGLFVWPSAVGVAGPLASAAATEGTTAAASAAEAVTAGGEAAAGAVGAGAVWAAGAAVAFTGGYIAGTALEPYARPYAEAALEYLLGDPDAVAGPTASNCDVAGKRKPWIPSKPGRKKQGREPGEKKKKDPSWKPRNPPKEPPKHTPSRKN